MRTSTKLVLLVLLAGLAPQALAQQPGSCRIGAATAILDANDIQATLFNTGGLFFGPSLTNGLGYIVPKSSDPATSPIFASGVWVGGTVGGELRVAAARYGSYNFWPGPLDETTGRPVDPTNCSQFDRMYSVTRQDIANFEAGVDLAPDLAEWPVDLGAPVVDGDGNPDNYDLNAGDRPDIVGDQGVWWVMNDVGGEHTNTRTKPLGIEIQALAFSFARANALGQTTFYRYRIINKGPNPIDNTYISVFSDPDLGDAGDDYVGVDTDLSLGYVYNDSNEDDAYGAAPPPAAGYDFFQGPIVGDDTLGATSFSTFINSTPAETTGDPQTGQQYYNYMQGLWGDGSPYTALGVGYQTTGEPTKFIYPGDPDQDEFWSEVNNDGQGGDNPPGDRRLVISTGPFTLERNQPQDIVFGLVYAQGASNTNSVTALKAADALAQTAFDNNFELAPPPPPPPLCDVNSPNPQLRPGSGNCFEAAELDGQATLVWGYPTNSPNYVGSFEVQDVLLSDQEVDDDTYNFEGFNLYRYKTSAFDNDTRELIATYDIINGVTRVIDLVSDADLGDLVPAVVARGSDSGLQYSYDIGNLTNNTDYYYGITAYSFNEESSPKVIESSATQITVRPSRLSSGDLTQSESGQSLRVTPINQVGQGVITANVVDPTAITGANYEVRFIRAVDEDGNDTNVITYNVVNTATGDILADGQDFYNRTGKALPQGENVLVAQGVSFNIAGPEPGISNFLVTANANGPIVPATGGSADFAGYPVPNRPGAEQQAGPAVWFFTVGGGADGSFDTFNARALRNDNIDRVGSSDFEMRWTGTSTSYRRFQDDALFEVPFELWNAGVATPDDPSDDFRMIPGFLDNSFEAAGNDVYDLSLLDDPISSADNDPETDWIYWYNPNDMSPGEAGYLAWEANAATAPADHGGEVLARTTIVGWNLGTAPPYPQDLPEQGTIFRIETFKPNQPGDVFSISTDSLQVMPNGLETAEEALDRIAVVPNPYMGESSYESGNLSRVVRFTNLPPEATTVQIYTVSGSLVKTLRKEGPSRSLDWNLETENNLPVASGMYLIRVEVQDVGERILKFGVVNRRTQITVF